MSSDDNRSTYLKRKLILNSFSIGFPLYYLVKNRNQIYRATKIQRGFYIKELVARTGLGLVLGYAIATYFYGLGPISKEKLIEKEMDKESLDYSQLKKQKFRSQLNFLPGKIKND